jgi:hypothetical protein
MSDWRQLELRTEAEEKTEERDGCCGGGCGGRRARASAAQSIALADNSRASAFLLAARLGGFPTEDLSKDVASLSAKIAGASPTPPAEAAWRALKPWLETSIAEPATAKSLFPRNRDAAGEPHRLATMLEYYGLLLIKQTILEQAGDQGAAQTLLETRRVFLSEELWNQLPTTGGATAAAAAALWTRDLVDEECGRLGIGPESSVDDVP